MRLVEGWQQQFFRKFRTESENNMSEQYPSSSERRSFLTRLSAGLTGFATGTATAQGQSTAVTRWQPERHEKDDWLDKIPGKHRLVFDTTTPAGLAEAIAYCNNFMRVNRSDYAL